MSLEPDIGSNEVDRADEYRLVLSSRRGESEAYGKLISRYMRRTYFVALGLVGSHEDAQDLSQEAFARVYRRHELLDPDRSFYGLLYKVLQRGQALVVVDR